MAMSMRGASLDDDGGEYKPLAEINVTPFVDVLLNGPYQAEADMNEDDEVNGLDVDPFVAAVVGGDDDGRAVGVGSSGGTARVWGSVSSRPSDSPSPDSSRTNATETKVRGSSASTWKRRAPMNRLRPYAPARPIISKIASLFAIDLSESL